MSYYFWKKPWKMVKKKKKINSSSQATSFVSILFPQMHKKPVACNDDHTKVKEVLLTLLQVRQLKISW